MDSFLYRDEDGDVINLDVLVINKRYFVDCDVLRQSNMPEMMKMSAINKVKDSITEDINKNILIEEYLDKERRMLVIEGRLKFVSPLFSKQFDRLMAKSKELTRKNSELVEQNKDLRLKNDELNKSFWGLTQKHWSDSQDLASGYEEGIHFLHSEINLQKDIISAQKYFFWLFSGMSLIYLLLFTILAK